MGTTLSIQAGLDASNVAFKAGWEEFFGGGKTPPGQHQFYCGEEPMTTETKRYDWLANYPMMERLIGSRRIGYLREYNQTIVLGPMWSQMLKFTRRQMETGDQLGLVGRSIQRFLKTQAGALDADAKAVYFSATGAGPTCYDGAALFSTAHPHGPSGNQVNLTASTNLSGPALDTVLTTMSGLKLENGEPMGVDGDTLIVGPALKYRALSLVGAMSDLRPISVDNAGNETGTRIATAASSNVFQGTLKVVVDPRRPATGTGAFYWEVVDSKLPPPLMRHMYRAPEPHHQDQMDSFCRFMNDHFLFGVEGDWVTDAGFWPSAHRATGTA